MIILKFLRVIDLLYSLLDTLHITQTRVEVKEKK